MHFSAEAEVDLMDELLDESEDFDELTETEGNENCLLLASTILLLVNCVAWFSNLHYCSTISNTFL